ncbi:MAG TPA: Gfo/Idh/MocA family oxidoreductase [Bacteroidota bacterium]|nr:Gfo/Idh/MocA family oxidoreductase [Bacteroidota bacterium]
MNPVRVIVLGCGNMGSSHARAYASLPGYLLTGLVDRNEGRAQHLAAELGNIRVFGTFEEAITSTHPDAASICTYTETHASLSLQAFEAGLHVFVEKPLAPSLAEAEEVIRKAAQARKKLVVGYILRQHPVWRRFIEEARRLGKPLVMRMNLNQQSSGEEWAVHKKLMQSMSPIVDCGVHYVDVMCQMTGSRPVRVQAVGARLSSEISPSMYNYGHLHLVFEDGSVGWYEAGWGPMMSETAYFVKDVIGPNGSVSIGGPGGTTIGGSAETESHTKTGSLICHDALTMSTRRVDCSDEPTHQELCKGEQAFFLDAITKDLDLTTHMADALMSLRIVLAADQSVRTGNVVYLSTREDT